MAVHVNIKYPRGSRFSGGGGGGGGGEVLPRTLARKLFALYIILSHDVPLLKSEFSYGRNS